MNPSLSLQFAALSLALICVGVVPFFLLHDPIAVPGVIPVEHLPRHAWASNLTRAGIACLLASFVLLLGGCYLLVT